METGLTADPNMGLGRRRQVAVAAIAVAALLCSQALRTATAATDTAANWDGTTNNWTSAAAWSTNPNYPNNGTPTGAVYAANISTAGSGPYAVTLNSNVTVDSLTIGNANATLDQTGGTLTANTVNLNAGTYTLDGGSTLANATVNESAGTLNVNNGTLSGVSVNGGNLNLGSGGSSLMVDNGLTLHGNTLNLSGSASTVSFIGNQAFGNGTIDLSSGDSGLLIGTGGNTALTLGTNAFVEGGGSLGGQNTSTLVNGGIINANISGQPLTISNGAFTNNGTAEATDGGTLNVDAANWSNAGTITGADGGVVNLGGSFTTAGIGAVNGNGATVNITGTLNNSNSTLALNSATGSWNLNYGTIKSGTLAFANGQTLNIIQGTLSGVSVTGGNLSLGQYSSVLVDKGLSLNGNSLEISGIASGVFFSGNQTFDHGTIDFLGGHSFLTAAADGNATLTLGVNALVEGGGGSLAQQDNSTLVSDGTIDANMNGQSISIINSVFTNNGTAEATNGGTLNINAASWSNAGTITGSSGAVVDLGGTFTTAGIGTFNVNGATVNITGTLDNSNNTLALNSATGSWNLNGGTIKNGALAFAGGQTLNVINGTLSGLTVPSTGLTFQQGSYLTLSDATLTGNFELPQNSSLYVINGASVGGDNIILNSGASLAFEPNQTFDSGLISGSGNIEAGYGGAGGLTLGANAAIEGSVNFYGAIYGNTRSPLSNNGTINANTRGQSLSINNSVFTNNGTAEATNGGILTINSPYWSNAGTIVGTSGSVVNLGGNFTTADIGTFKANGATVNVTGTLDNSNSTLVLNGAAGSWSLNGGTIKNGTVALADGQTLNIVSGMLSGVSVTGGNLNAGYNSAVTVENGLRLNGNALVSGPHGAIYFSGNQTFDHGTIRLTGPGSILYAAYNANTTLTLGTNALVEGGADLYQGNLINNGTINANTSGQSLSIDTSIFTNNGTAEATNGGTLNIRPGNGGAWTNNGILALDSNTGSNIVTASDLTFAVGSALNIVLGASGASGQLQVNGNLIIDPGDPSLNLSQLAGTTFAGPYLIATYTGTLTGTFGSVTPGYTVSYATPNDIYVTKFVAVPEPATLAILAVGALALLARRRRRVALPA